MLDPQMKYCSNCNDEYMPEIVNCGVCGEVLLSGAEMLEKRDEIKRAKSRRLGALTAHDDIVTIFKGPMAEAKRIESLFIRENIGTRILGEDGGCKKGCCAPDVELQVRRADALDAQKIIEHDFEAMTGISDYSHDIVDSGFDPNEPTSTCPACGFTFSTSDRTCPDCGLCFG